MTLNPKKTKVMVTDKKEKIQCVIKVGNKELAQVKEYKYLGSWITDNAKCEEVNRRIGKAKADFWKFKEFLRRDIHLKLKLRILKIYTFSVAGYGSEAWTFSSTVKKNQCNGNVVL